MSDAELFEVARCADHALVVRAPRGPSGDLPLPRPCPACLRGRPDYRSRPRSGGPRPWPKRRRGTDEKFDEVAAQVERDRWEA